MALVSIELNAHKMQNTTLLLLPPCRRSFPTPLEWKTTAIPCDFHFPVLHGFPSSPFSYCECVSKANLSIRPSTQSTEAPELIYDPFICVCDFCDFFLLLPRIHASAVYHSIPFIIVSPHNLDAFLVCKKRTLGENLIALLMHCSTNVFFLSFL